MLIKIARCSDSAIIYAVEAVNLKTVVEELAERNANLQGAYLEEANLEGANLRGANLQGAYLEEANLEGADLQRANLRGAYLQGAYLEEANLRGANLQEANLRGANLRKADLQRANLRGANLQGAYLEEANLRGANLEEADLTLIRDDLWAVLSGSPAEAHGLLAALRDGRVEGTTYKGDCACLVGTLANVRGCSYQEMGSSLRPNKDRHAERFFLGIRQGDTPDTNPVSKLAAEWTAEWLDAMHAAFGTQGTK